MQRSGMSQAEIIFKVEALMNKMSNFQGEQARKTLKEEEESNNNVQQQSNDKIQLTADINKNNKFQSENQQNLLEENIQKNTKNDIILEPKKQETEQGNSDTVTTTTDIKADINSFSEHNLNNSNF